MAKEVKKEEKKGFGKKASGEKKTPLSAEEKKAKKKERMENAGPKVVQVPLSVETGTVDGTKKGKANAPVSFTQHVSAIRGAGCFVTTTIVNSKGEAVGGNTIWVAGVKPKSKNGEKYLILDKGPKPKKDKTEKKAKK